MLRSTVLLACLSSAVAAPVPKALKAKPTLDGTWEATSMTCNGQNTLPGNTTVWVIKGDTLVRHRRQEDGTLNSVDASSPISLVADRDRPGEIDYTSSAGKAGTLFRARYEVTKDEFVISFGDVDGERPAELKEGVGTYFYKFKRVEP